MIDSVRGCLAPIVWSYYKQALLACVLVVMAGGIVVIAHATGFIDRAYYNYIFPGIALIFAVWFPLVVYAIRRLHRRAIDRNRQICGVCGYLIDDHSDLVVCTECGTAYALPLLKMYWEGLFDIPTFYAVVLCVVSMLLGLPFLFILARFVFGPDHGYGAIVLSPAVIASVALGLHLLIPNCRVMREKSAQRASRDFIHIRRTANTSRNEGHYTTQACTRRGASRLSICFHWEEYVIIPSRRAWEAIEREENEESRS